MLFLEAFDSTITEFFAVVLHVLSVSPAPCFQTGCWNNRGYAFRSASRNLNRWLATWFAPQIRSIRFPTSSSSWNPFLSYYNFYNDIISCFFPPKKLLISLWFLLFMYFLLVGRVYSCLAWAWKEGSYVQHLVSCLMSDPPKGKIILHKKR